MFNNNDLNIDEYIEHSPNFSHIFWHDLPDSLQFKLTEFPEDIKKFGDFISLKRLKQTRQFKSMTQRITDIRGISGYKNFHVHFPINLKNIDYAKLYALMISEGYYNSEFALNVPELFFHQIFRESIANLISVEATRLIKEDHNKGFLRSRAPAIIRHLIPIPKHIPRIILEDKILAREYLRVAFEAEGSPILDKARHKRYIKLTRYNDISEFISNESLSLKKRIYSSEIKSKYSFLFNKIKQHPPRVLLGEKILLKRQFNIDSQLCLEAIRKNCTGFRAGKISARWVLLIYANNIDKFIQEIGFISERKNNLLEEMKKIKGNNQQYYALEIIQKVSDNQGYFYRKDFIKEMKGKGYKSPSCYLNRYLNKKIIIKIKRGYYQTVRNLDKM